MPALLLESRRVLTVLACGIAVLASGCASKSPEELVAERRTEYSASMNGFFIEQVPLVPAGGETEGEATAPEEATEGVADDDTAAGSIAEDGIEVAELSPVAVSKAAMIDLLLRSDSYDGLDGITVDLTLSSEGGAGAVKQTWHVWVDTSSLGKGASTQITHRIEDVPYEDGDGFFAEIRHPIPEAERGDYREFGSS